MWRNKELEILLRRCLLLVILANPPLHTQPVLPSKRIRKKTFYHDDRAESRVVWVGMLPTPHRSAPEY